MLWAFGQFNATILPITNNCKHMATQYAIQMKDEVQYIIANNFNALIVI
jgi:hypothetical protein